MSNETAISMRELEDESVELLPSRETLCGCNPCSPCCGFSVHIELCASLCF
jgi:hypothetical protein